MSANMVLAIGPKNKTTFVPSDRTIGQRIYANGKPLTACLNEDQRRGWQQVAKVDADADTAAYLATRDDWMVESDEIRHGWM